MRQFVCQRQGIMEASEGLRWVPQQPENYRGKGSAANTQILANAEHWSTMLVSRISCNAFLQVLVGGR
jgi:hypothetical protein